MCSEIEPYQDDQYSMINNLHNNSTNDDTNFGCMQCDFYKLRCHEMVCV